MSPQKIRVTNNSELQLDEVEAVFRTDSGAYRIVMKDGSARTIRRALLTPEGLEAVEQIAAGSKWSRP